MSRAFSINKCCEMRDLAEHLEGHRLNDPHIGPEDCDLIVAALRHAVENNHIPAPAQTSQVPSNEQIEALAKDFVARWHGDDWHLLDGGDRAEFMIDAHRWLKCWFALAAQPPAAPVETGRTSSDGGGESRPASTEPQASASRRPQGLIGEAGVAPSPSDPQCSAESTAELTSDFAQALPGGKMDDSTYAKIEDALDRINAPFTDASGKWLSLHERIAALRPMPDERQQSADTQAVKLANKIEETLAQGIEVTLGEKAWKLVCDSLRAQPQKLPELTATCQKLLPGGIIDDSTYSQIEDALDTIDAPMTGEGGRYLTLAERIAALALTRPHRGSAE